MRGRGEREGEWERERGRGEREREREGEEEGREVVSISDDYTTLMADRTVKMTMRQNGRTMPTKTTDD